MKRLSEEAVAVLGSMEVTGNQATITAGQLDRALYVEVNKALEAIGGKWIRKAKAHLFEGDPRDALDQVVLSGGYTDAKREFDFFETPVALAARLCTLAGIGPAVDVGDDTSDAPFDDQSMCMFALEPSAGKGAIAGVARARGAQVMCVELDPRNRTYLEKQRFTVAKEGDFLKHPAPEHGEGNFHCVVMNPPFSRQQDIDHVRHAAAYVRPGGRLAAIMSAGVKFRQNKKTAEFKEFMHSWFYDLEIIDNPPGSFEASGTGVNTVIVAGTKRSAFSAPRGA